MALIEIAVAYSESGEFEKALELAESIESPDSKSMALIGIAVNFNKMDMSISENIQNKLVDIVLSVE